MKNLTRIDILTKEEIVRLLNLADELKSKKQEGIVYKPLMDKTVITSFPPTSLRTRISFEAGIFQLGAQSINLPINFDGREPIEDIVGYLNSLIDCLIIRHPDQELIERIGEISKFPIINAMSKKFHPCEILSDLQKIRELRKDLSSLKFVFIGEGANISNTWFTAAARLNLNIIQVCPPGYEIDKEILNFAAANSKGMVGVTNNIEEGLADADIILTDGWPPEQEAIEKFKPYRISLDKLRLADKMCIVNPCPPFTRGHEIDDEVINSRHFIGYNAKENLLHMQKAVLIELMG